jgi:hypothetical protein
VELRHIEHKAITNVVALEPFECVADLRYRKHLDIRYDCLLGAEADFFWFRSLLKRNQSTRSQSDNNLSLFGAWKCEYRGRYP